MNFSTGSTDSWNMGPAVGITPSSFAFNKLWLWKGGNVNNSKAGRNNMHSERRKRELFEKLETNYSAKHSLQDCFILHCTTLKIGPTYYEDQKGFLNGGLLEKILHFFIQVSIMYVAFSSWLILRRLLTVWRGHLSKSRWLNSTLVAALYDGYKLFNVTLSLVCQLIDNILNGSMSKENWLVHFTRHLSIQSLHIYIYIDELNVSVRTLAGTNSSTPEPTHSKF